MSNVAKNTIKIMIITLSCKILGFGREIVFGSIYGFSNYGGIYLAVINIPDIIFALIGSCIMTTFIPLHYEIKNKHGEEKSSLFLNNIVTITIIISLITTISSMIFTEELLKVFAMGLKGKDLEIAISFTKILIPGGFFITISSIMNAYLNISEDFITPAFVSIPFNIIVIIAIVISSNSNPYIMVIGTTIGMSSKFIFQAIVAYKKGYRYKFVLNLKDKYIHNMIKLSAPILIGVAVSQINTVADKSIATSLGLKSVAALSYANKLNGFVIGIFIVSLVSVIYPRLSELLVDDDKEGFIETISKSINIIIIFIIPISMGAILLSQPIVKILFERHQFDSTATKMTSIALSCYSIGLIAYAMRDILGKIFYSLKDTKTPMINGVISVVLNIILNIILSKKFGYVGLALATSISSILCVCMLFISMNKKVGYFGQDKILITFLKSIISSIVMGISVMYSYNYISNIGYNNIIGISISVTVGAIVYLLLIYILKVKEIEILMDIIAKLRKKICR